MVKHMEEERWKIKWVFGVGVCGYLGMVGKVRVYEVLSMLVIKLTKEPLRVDIRVTFVL